MTVHHRIWYHITLHDMTVWYMTVCDMTVCDMTVFDMARHYTASLTRRSGWVLERHRALRGQLWPRTAPSAPRTSPPLRDKTSSWARWGRRRGAAAGCRIDAPPAWRGQIGRSRAPSSTDPSAPTTSPVGATRTRGRKEPASRAWRGTASPPLGSRSTRWSPLRSGTSSSGTESRYSLLRVWTCSTGRKRRTCMEQTSRLRREERVVYAFSEQRQI